MLLQPMLEHFVQALQHQLSVFIKGVYIVGSVASGHFDVHHSDVDFVVTLLKVLDEDALRCLAQIHDDIEQMQLPWKLSGIYVLMDPDTTAWMNQPSPYYDEGHLYPGGHFEHNMLGWWMFKKVGVPIFGPDTDAYPFDVSWQVVEDRMYDNLHTYWRQWTFDLNRLVALTTNDGLCWVVLGVLRQHYSFEQKAIASKVEAGHFAKISLSACWHPLIDEAINIRQSPDLNIKSRYCCASVRALDAVHLLMSMLDRHALR